jgi:hypothetical protein
MSKRSIASIFSLVLVAFSSQLSFAQVRIEARHVTMLHPGVDTAWGSYMFGVRNEGTAPAKFSGYLTLPKETIDFQPQEGLSPEEIHQDGEKGLMFEKEFPPGMTLIAVGFKVNGRFGAATLTYVPKGDLDQMSFVTKKGGLNIATPSSLFGAAHVATMQNEEFLAIDSNGSLGPGSSFSIEVTNLPEGRGRLWMVGAILSLILVIGAIWFTWQTRELPKLQENAEFS